MSSHPFIFLISSRRAVVNFAVMVALCSGVIVAAIAIVATVLRVNRVQLMQTSSGLAWRFQDDEVQVFTLPASQPWVSSGFEVHKGDRVTVRASGRVNLALHRIVQGAQTKQRPGLPWVGPEGLPPGAVVDDPARRELHQRQCVLLKGEPLGALVAAVGLPDSDVHNLQAELIGRGREYTAPRDGVLFFSVNDILFDSSEESRACFDSAPRNNELEMTFEQLKQQRYWNAWFDDNIGEFLVTIRRE